LPQALYELLELSYSLVAYLRLRQEARIFRPDCIYERYNLFLLAGALLKRELGIPLLLEINSPLVQERSLHGGLRLEKLARWAEGTAWRSADHVLPVTRVLGRYVAEYGVPKARITVIPNGINVAHFAEAPAPEAAKAALGLADDLVLGFTGFVREWHGVDRVVRWLATSEAPANAMLLVVGDGPARGALESLAKALGIAERVRFTGVLDRRQVPARVAAFDVALQPAVTAYASPLKLMEYLALGKAIVAPAEPNLREILEDGENALIFDTRDERGLETALTRLCGDAALRRKLSLGARETIVKRDLTWLGNARKVTRLVSRRKNS
jgi:glycosyltransferase involved in cell wall biosynthesis